MVVLVAGCGGSDGSAHERLVRGTGYSFAGPAGWRIARANRQLSLFHGVSLVSVTRYRLRRGFSPALWQEALGELDRAADGIASQQNGSVGARRTVTISGLQARRYDVGYERDGKRLVERLGFVLRGKEEYLLLCRYERSGDTAACDRLFRSFRLA